MMIALLTTLFSSIGSAGFGSLLKMVSGYFDSKAEAQKDIQKREMLLVLQQRNMDKEFAALVFGGGAEAARQGRITRRLVALIGAASFAFLMVYCALKPNIPLTTFTVVTGSMSDSYLWGFIRIAPDAPITVEITTGHLLVVGISHIGLIFGFYFTPGGRK
jgi:hypothetical protein